MSSVLRGVQRGRGCERDATGTGRNQVGVRAKIEGGARARPGVSTRERPEGGHDEGSRGRRIGVALCRRASALGVVWGMWGAGAGCVRHQEWGVRGIGTASRWALGLGHVGCRVPGERDPGLGLTER